MDCIRVKLKSVNAHITCYICKGYLVDATTVLDCLHTFCKSCLLKHFEEESPRCPKCEILIHQSHPAHYVSIDRTMQDLVYKLVPNMQRRERERREKFCRRRGLSLESVRSESLPLPEESANRDVEEEEPDNDTDYHKSDEQFDIGRAPASYDSSTRQDDVSVFRRQLVQCLNSESSVLISGNKLKLYGLEVHHASHVNLHLLTVDHMKQLVRQYLRVSEHATVTHIKKYLAAKLYFDIERFMDFDIFCNDELMGKDHSLKFILRTRWRNKADEPLELHYRKHVEF